METCGDGLSHMAPAVSKGTPNSHGNSASWSAYVTLPSSNYQIRLMAEHCKDKLMVEGEMIPKSMQPGHPLAVPEMDTTEGRGSNIPHEMYRYRAHTYHALNTLGATV